MALSIEMDGWAGAQPASLANLLAGPAAKPFNLPGPLAHPNVAA